MKIIDKKNKKRIKTNKDRKEQGGTEAIVKGWELNNFVVHLSFSPINSKASLVFKSNLELALSII